MKVTKSALLFFFFLFICQTVLGFEITYPGEEGFFIDLPLPYVVPPQEPNEETEEGIFIFGESKVVIDGVEYYDCLFETSSNASHFFFALDEENEALILQGLKTGLTELTISPPVSILCYPLSPESTWQKEGIVIIGKNIEIPNLGTLAELAVKGVEGNTTVSLVNIIVPAGNFETLCVETVFKGNILNIPVELVHRSWLTQYNVIVRRSLDFVFFEQKLPVFDMELKELSPSQCQPVSNLVQCWGKIKIDFTIEIGREFK